ncbi:MAG: hypothetical protein CMB02_00850 [Euryarchaeota archaeon]|nr:hypothetical protein [Euryarchaeota archaeon]|tara:strand:+ start:332 stop:634 length:303 start_codon:yes stop_codon:yes gene_type:complete
MRLYITCIKDEMMRVVAYWISTAMVMISIIFSWNEKAVTAEVWALLLLTPLPIALALSIENKQYKQNTSMKIIWDEEEEDIDLNNQIGDPEEAGFDVPVL